MRGSKAAEGDARKVLVQFRETEPNMARLEAAAREGESPGQTARRLARQMLDILDGVR